VSFTITFLSLDLPLRQPHNVWVAVVTNMGTHMKTTVEISDALLDEVKKLASREGTTVRTLVEQGLRQVISQRKQRRAFRLRNASFKGHGLSADAKRLDWERLRELAYEGRGG
jgi:hypothetical protein